MINMKKAFEEVEYQSRHQVEFLNEVIVKMQNDEDYYAINERVIKECANDIAKWLEKEIIRQIEEGK
ncbi:MAG: hypothetical protein ACRDA3_00040 [Peptostreptococcaceae bacterium]